MQKSGKSILVALLCSVLAAPVRAEPEPVAKPRLLRREIPTPPSSEYYTTDPEAVVLVRVNIWGEVRQPGIHYVPAGASVSESLSAAGGPLASASLPAVRLVRGDVESSVDLYSPSARNAVVENDMIFVERSFKQDLPLVFNTISVVLSLATFYLVYARDQKN